MEDFTKNTKGDWIINVLMAAILVVCAIAGTWAVIQAGRIAVASIEYLVDSAAIEECEKWQDYERVFPEWDPESRTGYFITPWQEKQCDSVGVELRAHVIDYTPND